MKLEFVHHPKTIPEAVDMLVASVEDDEKDYLLKNDAGHMHHGFGRFLRNNWHLWDHSTPIVQWTGATYGAMMADDVSSLILEAFVAKVRGVEVDLNAEADRFKAHWKQMKCDPLTGELNREGPNAVH